MTAIAVLVPVLDRPANAVPLVASFDASEADAELWFLCTPGDDEQLAVVDKTGKPFLTMPEPAGPGDYARKINLGFAVTRAPYVLCGADDLRFHPGWDTALLQVAEEFDVGVVSTNDLGNGAVMAGRHATHPLVARCYIDRLGGYVDGPGSVYFEGYDHQWVDVELVETAKARGCFAPCLDSRVEHLHPLWRKGAMDATYRKGQARGAADRALFESRRHLWEREQVPA
jgi:hypothetical protein